MVELYSNYSMQTKKIIKFIIFLMVVQTWIEAIIFTIGHITMNGDLPIKSRELCTYSFMAQALFQFIFALGIPPFRMTTLLCMLLVFWVCIRIVVTRTTGWAYPGFWHTIW